MTEWPSSEQLAVWDPTREPPPTLSEVAKRERVATGRVREGLPVSDQIVDGILGSELGAGDRSGIFTAAEREDMLGDRERVEIARAVLSSAGENLAEVAVGWYDGRRVVKAFLTAEPERCRQLLTAALGTGRVVVEAAKRSRRELEQLQHRLRIDRTRLAEAGIIVTRSAPRHGQLEVDYYAADPLGAERLMRKRYGEGVALYHRGASPRLIRPQPFGSWLADGTKLHLFYALPLNGEQPAGCLVGEHQDAVIVSVFVSDSRCAKTLVGGFVPSHVSVELAAPLGNRAVIDNATNQARPHWELAAAIRTPRPQDL